ncbi:torsin-1A-like [Diabrotica virgifera virgifera]|uniref:Torsin-1A-like n=1 Tax=Diabrotica virgifera virgifera TaxID=50390 RepID=A0A6P7GFA4_DIAVI|nr:torsin-1A-like [Diabrotica virgifera virgifera]
MAVTKVTYLFLIFTLCIQLVHPIIWNPLCWFGECCNKNDIIDDIQRLRATMKRKVYGQHLAESAVDAIQSHLYFKPDKPLTISFHGWAGSGKNYVSSFIAENLYKHGVKSKFVQTFIGRLHFPEASKVYGYKRDLYNWIKGNVSSCSRQLFIFDEVDKMPTDLLNAIKPILDHKGLVEGVDYTRAIFIFLSNTGSNIINQHYLDLWNSGRQRENMKLSDFESLVMKGAFTEKGGFQFSDVVKSNLIDHYIPFLPMQEAHVKECIKDQFRERGITNPTDDDIKEIMSFIEWGPEGVNLFSKTGCKRISAKVGKLVVRKYPEKLRYEL